MPELPEAETIVRGLRPTVVGRSVRRVSVLRPDVLRAPPRLFSHLLRGRRLEGVGRRGKNVVFDLGGGDVLAVNLGMTGRLLPFARPPRGSCAPAHPAVRFGFDDGGVLVFDDTRRFGTVEFLSREAWAERSGRMGPEPLAPDFGPGDLHVGLSRSRSPCRSWLLDQKRIAGVGNIYANEALYRAGVHPRRRAETVTAEEAARLHTALRDVLIRAIDAGGTTLRDYRDAEGNEGRYARRLAVYGRDGEACPSCGDTVERLVFGNRSAFLCPTCQPARPGSAAAAPTAHPTAAT